jgi:hypothetical protein
MSPRHVIVVGAARSGTKMLRNALAVATGVGAVPYDIGYVWRHGNERAPDDVLVPAQLRDRSRRFIERFVDGYAAGEVAAVIEKTVGNTLRVPFVASVFPDAFFVHLIRDGVDVAESSRRQWTARTDWRYAAAKMRHVPFRLAPHLARTQLGSLGAHALRGDQRIGSWGPRYPGIDADLAAEALLVVCARQWRESVLAATRAFEEPELRVCEVRYEDLVSHPAASLERLTDFMKLPATGAALATAASSVGSDRIGAGRTALSPADSGQLAHEIGNLLVGLGYEPPHASPRASSPWGQPALNELERHPQA